MIKPKALEKGNTIGLIAPASPPRVDGIVDKCVEILKQQGYHVVEGESCRAKYGHLAGTDEVRANDVNKMFRDKNIDAVFCMRGGYGTPRILDKIDWEMIRSNPKLFVGYSDITAIHVMLNKFCNLVTMHGPMVCSDMVEGMDAFTESSYRKAMTSRHPLGFLKNPEGQEIKCLNPGKAEGIIVGGNLELITTALGTPYEIDTRGKLLLLEDVGEHTYRLDRSLTHLRLAGKFADCAGIILGDFRDCSIEHEGYGLSLQQVFEDIVLPSGKPVIYNFMAGHCKTKITVPLGVRAVLDANARGCTLEVVESALS